MNCKCEIQSGHLFVNRRTRNRCKWRVDEPSETRNQSGDNWWIWSILLRNLNDNLICGCRKWAADKLISGYINNNNQKKNRWWWWWIEIQPIRNDVSIFDGFDKLQPSIAFYNRFPSIHNCQSDTEWGFYCWFMLKNQNEQTKK